MPLVVRTTNAPKMVWPKLAQGIKTGLKHNGHLTNSMLTDYDCKMRSHPFDSEISDSSFSGFPNPAPHSAPITQQANPKATAAIVIRVTNALRFAHDRNKWKANS